MITTTTSGALRPDNRDWAVDAPFIACDVPLEIARLRAEHAYALEGHAGRTLAKYPDLRVVLEAMKAGERLPFHETSERMAMHVLFGRILLRDREGHGHELGEGGFAAVDAERIHEIECLRECAFLLTMAWPPAHGVPAGEGGDGTGV